MSATTQMATVIPMSHTLQLKKILYATDFSEASLAALPIAAAFARRFDSTLCVAHIWSALTVRMMSAVAATSAYDQLQDAAGQRMEQLLKDGRLESLRCVPIIVEGSPTERLTPMLADESIDLIVVGTHGKSGLKRLLVGSVAENICRTATCPVVTVGPNADKRFYSEERVQSILCPVDLSGQSTSILPYVASVASEFDSDISLLHVLPASVASKDIAGNLARRLRQELQNLCRLHISPRRESNCRVEFGDPVEAILNVAKQVRADVIALGVRTALPFGLPFKDTVTNQLMMQASCPVLTYRSRWWM
jgi:nucleotide-binding universal stress UspA family protein